MSFLHRLFKFRIFKFRTNLAEELEDCHLESINLKESLIQTRLHQRKLTRSFAIYAVLIYLIVNVTYFTLFLSHDNMIRLYAVLTSVGIGAILFGIHWILRWYFRTIIRMREDQLTLFKDRKQELIEEVKKKETYTKAKALLEKYGETMEPISEPAPSTIPNANKNARQSGSVTAPVSTSDKPMISISPTNAGTLQPTTTQVPVTVAQNRPSMNGPAGKLPRAILPPQRTFWGAILDVIVGDGPSKRYALICKSCNSHNGMALEEEYEYLSYRCAYCNYFNSARKQKPVFSGDIVAHDPQPTSNQAQNDTTTEQMEVSSSDSSESISNNETDIRHRSINVVNSESRSRSPSVEQRPALSSSNDNLTKED